MSGSVPASALCGSTDYGTDARPVKAKHTAVRAEKGACVVLVSPVLHANKQETRRAPKDTTRGDKVAVVLPMTDSPAWGGAGWHG